MPGNEGKIIKLDSGAMIMLLSAAAVSAYVYYQRVDVPAYDLRLKLHQQILEGSAPSPYNYRILVPAVVDFVSRVLSIIVSDKTAFLYSYALYDLLAIFLILASLLVWLRTWFSREQALIGCLFVAATIPIALQNHYFQPWSLLEPGIFTIALLAIYHKRYYLLGVLVFIGTLNRETAVFIPLAYLAANLNIPGLVTGRFRPAIRDMAIFAGLMLIWGVVYLSLHWFQGGAQQIISIRELIIKNTTPRNMLYALLNASLFLGAFWFFAILGIKSAPDFIKRVLFIIPLYLVTVIIWGVWLEVRLLMPLYSLLIPCGLSFV